MDIPRDQIPVLSDAVESAFPRPVDLRDFLLILNDSIDNYTGLYGDFPSLRIEMIRQYNARGHIDRLLLPMLAARPDNGRLAQFAWRHGLAYQPPKAAAEVASSSGGLEQMLDPQRGFRDFGALLNRLGGIANAICQISYPVTGGTVHGTGFLIGNGTVLTNWHVVEHVATANRKDVKLLFDFRTGRTGTPANESVYRLLDDDRKWLIDHSPYHPKDMAADNLAQRLADTRPNDCLDYAVLRLNGNPGAAAVKTASGGTVRGFLPLPAGPTEPADFQADVAGLFIIQHPFDPATLKPLPLQYDWDKPAVRGANANATRVLYGVNTRPGSSGSPCFNPTFELVALHQAGGKDWPANVEYLYNQGIPIARVRKLLEDRRKLREIT
jgi:hypothetical protein